VACVFWKLQNELILTQVRVEQGTSLTLWVFCGDCVLLSRVCVCECVSVGGWERSSGGHIYM
jgi:hypothetical protein